MLAGLVLLVASVRLSNPNLALFLVSGALIGAGVGAVFKGTTGIVLEAAAPEDRLALTSKLLVVLYVGLSIPVVGAGIALDQGASIPNTVLGIRHPRRAWRNRFGLGSSADAARCPKPRATSYRQQR